MEYPLSILGSNPTKHSIIELLSHDWPLTAKKIFNKLTINKNDNNIKSKTYQATYKAIQELVQGKILDKTSNGYIINKQWVKELGHLSERMKSDLDNHHLNREIKTFHKINFESHIEFIKFHMNLIKSILMKGEKVDMTFHFRHVPYPHVLSVEEVNELKPHIKNIKWTILSKNSTPLDKWCAEFWRKIGVNVVLDADIATDAILNVTNDYVASVHLSKESKEKWDEIFSETDVNNINMQSLTETLLNTSYKSLAIIIKDKELADLLRF